MAAICAAAALVACADISGVRPFWTLHDSIIQVKPGMSKAEVRKLVGNPIMVFNFPRLEEEAWMYDYLEGQIRMKSWVHFSVPQGVVKYATREYDSSYYAVEGR